MNFENVGTPVAIIKPEEEPKKKIHVPIISVTDRSGARNPFNRLVLKEGEGKYQLIPNPEIERQILYITGASGSGKSYFTRQYCNEYQRIFPKRPIILISSVSDDSSIDAIKGLKRLKLTPDFLEETFEINDLRTL